MDVSEILQRVFANDLKALERIPAKLGLDKRVDHLNFDCKLAEEVLGRPFIDLEKCVKDMAESLWELEKKLKHAQA